MSSKQEENPAKQPVDAEEEVPLSPQSKPSRRKRRPPAQPWRKPPGFPKRYLSAYNLFFKQERERLMKAGVCSDSSLPEGRVEEGKEDLMVMKPTLPDPCVPKSNAARKHARSSGIGFANLARIVAKKWKTLDPELKAPFEEVAMVDKGRYQREMVVWRAEQEKKKETKVDGDHSVSVAKQWGSAVQPYLSSYSCPMSDTHESCTPQRGDWPAQHANPSPSQNGRSPSFSLTDAPKSLVGANSRIHIFGSPFQGGAGANARETLSPCSKSVAEDDVSPVSISPGRGPDPVHRRANSFDSRGGYRAIWEGYQPQHYLTRRGGNNGYSQAPHVAPYAMQYAHVGAGRPEIPYGKAEEGCPVPVRHISLPRAGHPYSSPLARYDMPYPVRVSGYSYGYPYYPYPNNPQTQAKYSLLTHSPDPYEKQPVVTPYAGGFRPPGPLRFQDGETLQLRASRDDFKNQSNSEASRAVGVEDKKRAKTSIPTDMKTKGAKNEESSLLESSYEIIDTNLDTDTVDFLTTLELE